jgi:hypothetical protein
MTDDHSAHGRRDDPGQFLLEFAREPGREREREPAGAHRIHQHARALQVMGAVTARGEQEMAFQQGLARPEFGKHVVFLHCLDSLSLELGGPVAAASMIRVKNSPRGA